MKRFRLEAVLTTAALLACSVSAHATGFYLTGGVTATKLESDGLQEAAASAGLGASGEVDDTAVGYQLGVGYMFSDVFGVELKYGDSGDAEETITFTDGFVFVPFNVKASIDGFTLYGVAQTSFAEGWTVYGKLGYTSQSGDVKASGYGVSVSDSDDDDGFAVAGGLAYQINPNWAVTGELEYFAVDFGGAFKEPVRGSINLQYHFGT